MNMFRRQFIVRDQGSTSNSLGEMAEKFAMGVHRTEHVTAAMSAEQRPVHRAIFGQHPHRLNAAGVDFDVVNASRLGGHVAPVVKHASQILQWHVVARGHRVRPTSIQILEGHRLVFGHYLPPARRILPLYLTGDEASSLDPSEIPLLNRAELYSVCGLRQV